MIHAHRDLRTKQKEGRDYTLTVGYMKPRKVLLPRSERRILAMIREEKKRLKELNTRCPTCEGKGFIADRISDRSEYVALKKKTITQLVEAGWSYRKIAQTLHIASPSTVSYYLRK